MSGPDHTGPCVPEIDLPMNADGTAGSGCTPPSDATLPDGLWFGYLADASPDSIAFDLACSYHFDSEQHLANLEGSELETYTWTNDETDIRVLGVSDSAGYCVEWEWIPWIEAPLADPSLVGPVWIGVNSGVVTEIVVPPYS